MPHATFHFPRDFRWGCATSAHQVEGDNVNNDWWLWEQVEGHIRAGHQSGQACDWWRDAGRDFDLAAGMHHNAHRLSIEWSRVEPSDGQWDDAALDRYRAMLEGLRQRGIEPMVTLHHFTTPLWLVEQGGWENPAILPRFERFVEHVVQGLGDLCDLWCTINEPTVYAMLGWVAGAPADAQHHQMTFPPGKHEPDMALAVMENMFLAHGVAYHTIHRLQPAARVGPVHNMTDIQPANPNSPLDRFVAGQRDRILNQSLLDAVFHGKLPRLVGLSKRAPQIKSTADFFGLNYYTRNILAFDRHSMDTLFSRQVFLPGAPMSDGMYGEIYPDGLYRMLRRLSKYGLPIYITENGLPDADDDQRPAFLITHLRQVWWAIQTNIPVMGYYHWTLSDNFEWAEGWNLRFGLVELDRETQERKLRKSGQLFGEIAAANAITTDMVSRYAPELMEKLFPG
ncbi:MAG: glycoside hydrolase family 1 protein [Thermoflexales bacterium]|nr:glycoside hydrolase family 1 protein [Thermoflexales bacterium]